MKCSQDESHKSVPTFITADCRLRQFSPELPGARRFTFLARVLPVLSADVNKREWELLKTATLLPSHVPRHLILRELNVFLVTSPLKTLELTTHSRYL